MGITGIWQWVIILAIVLILFARPGKISGIMGDLGKGLRKFKSGMKGSGDAGRVEAKASATGKKATKKKASKKRKKTARKTRAKG